MMVYRKTNSKCWMLTVTTRENGYVRRSSGTWDKPTADGMQEMLNVLSRRGSRDWDIVDAIVAKRSKVKVPEVYDYYVRHDLDGLRAKLADLDLAPDVDAWEKEIKRQLAKESVRKYVAQVAVIFPKDADGKRLPAMRSTFTKASLKRKLAEVGGKNTNRARHGAAWNSVFDYLTELAHFERSPMRDVTVPSSDETDEPHIDELADVLALVNAMPAGAHRAMAAFREGAGVEIQAALKARASDIVDAKERIMWAHGEKNKYRDRQVIVDEWAFTIIQSYVQANSFLPGARLFPVTEKSHRTEHNDAVKALRAAGRIGIPEGYTLHNCRNTFYIRGLREGREPQLLSNNLGHGTTAEGIRRYGKYRMTIVDIIRADARQRGVK
jgi:integrase